MRRPTGSAISAFLSIPRWGCFSLLWSVLIGLAILVWVGESRPIPGENAFRVTTLASLVALALLDVPFFRRRAGDIKGVLRFIIAFVVLLVGLSAGQSLDLSAAILAAAIPPGLAYLYAHRTHERIELARTAASEAEARARHAELLNALNRVDSELLIGNGPVKDRTAHRALMLGAAVTAGMLIGAVARRKD